MKRTFLTSTLLAGMLFMGLRASAGNFYVCSGTSFTLTPSTTSTFAVYEWSEGATILQSGAGANLSTSVTLAAASTAEVKTYALRVQDANGCWSAAVTHTVYVLPALTADIDGPAFVCSNETPNEMLTASTNFSSLDLSAAPGLDYAFTWTGGGTAGGSHNETNTVTAVGTYDVSIAYTLPANDGAKLNGCDGADSHTIGTNTAPTAPIVSIQ